MLLIWHVISDKKWLFESCINLSLNDRGLVKKNIFYLKKIVENAYFWKLYTGIVLLYLIFEMFLYESWNKISYTIYIRDHLLERFLPTVHRPRTASRYVCPSRKWNLLQNYTYENYINPSISTSLEYNIDWQKTFHLYHFPPVFDMHPKRSQAP